MKCVKCGAVVEDDHEWRKRYEQLVAQGIVPMMVYICKTCRDRISAVVRFQLTDTKGTIQ